MRKTTIIDVGAFQVNLNPCGNGFNFTVRGLARRSDTHAGNFPDSDVQTHFSNVLNLIHSKGEGIPVYLKTPSGKLIPIDKAKLNPNYTIVYGEPGPKINQKKLGLVTKKVVAVAALADLLKSKHSEQALNAFFDILPLSQKITKHVSASDPRISPRISDKFARGFFIQTGIKGGKTLR